MKNKWYDSDWSGVLLFVIGLIVMVIGNYIYNGGHLVW